MADNYMQFSEQIDGMTAQEKAWVYSMPDGIEVSDDPQYKDTKEWTAAMNKLLEEHGIETKEIQDTLDMFPHFGWECDKHWHLYLEESGFLEHVAVVVQAFIRKFRPEMVFKLTWCEYCNKMRVGEFGGGWLVVNKDEAVYGNTYQQADEIASALATGDFKA
jgi:hypothetical protein